MPASFHHARLFTFETALATYMLHFLSIGRMSSSSANFLPNAVSQGKAFESHVLRFGLFNWT
jgi:hypothetical protein